MELAAPLGRPIISGIIVKVQISTIRNWNFRPQKVARYHGNAVVVTHGQIHPAETVDSTEKRNVDKK